MNNITKSLALTFALTATASGNADAFNDYDLRSTRNIEGLRASIVAGSTPKAFQVNFKFLSNLGADLSAESFVIHQQRSKPSACPDFRSANVQIIDSTRTTRTFDLSMHPYILEALKRYNCVIVNNDQPY
tara:strand:- start:20 stop:409 length:390 start_codon:yes stop_codon:yes gene_type:complete